MVDWDPGYAPAQDAAGLVQMALLGLLEVDVDQ